MKISTNTLAKALWRNLSQNAYQLQGNNIIKRRNESYLIFEFIRERNTVASASPSFAIDMGFSLDIVRRFEGFDTMIPSAVDECHWKERLMLPNDNNQFWLTARDATELSQNIQILASIINSQELLSCYTSECVVSSWRQSQSPGLTDYQRIKYLSIILFQQNDPEAEEYLGRLKQLDRRMGIDDELLYDKIINLNDGNREAIWKVENDQ